MTVTTLESGIFDERKTKYIHTAYSVRSILLHPSPTLLDEQQEQEQEQEEQKEKNMSCKQEDEGSFVE